MDCDFGQSRLLPRLPCHFYLYRLEVVQVDALHFRKAVHINYPVSEYSQLQYVTASPPACVQPKTRRRSNIRQVPAI